MLGNNSADHEGARMLSGCLNATSVDSAEMPWLSSDTVNGVIFYFFMSLLYFFNTKVKDGDGVEINKDNIKCNEIS